MDQSKLPHEAIERYLLDQMGKEEAVAFEQSITNSEALSEEVALQRSIIKGLQETRKMELKSRLAQIPVSASPWAAAMQSTWLKMATGALVVGSISLVAYYQLDTDKQAEQIADLPKEIVEVAVPAQVDAEIIEIPESTEEEQAVEETSRPIEEKQPEVSTPVERESDEEEINPVPQVSIPVPVNPDTDLAITEVNIEEETSLPFVSESSSPLAVDLIIESSKRTYRYFDGELSLKGDYKDITYDILEINSKEGRKLYLLIDGIYYSLTPTDSYLPLQRITDTKVRKQLDVLRDYK